MRAVLLVIDGLGVGAMDDCTGTRPVDVSANTLRHVAERVGGLHLLTLGQMGLGNILVVPGICASAAPLASFAECLLAYYGADSFLGHQEIMGTIPRVPCRTLMFQAESRLAIALRAGGHKVASPFPGLPILLVDDAVVIGDNLEAEPGQIINLTVPTSQIDFNHALEIGRIVRGLVEVSRVIVFGGPHIGVADILENVEVRPSDQAGVNSPKLGVYDSNLVVRHLGFGVDSARQLANVWVRAGKPVGLFGKMADLVDCPSAERNAAVVTGQVMDWITRWLQTHSDGLVAATVQETDLAGHENDANRYAAVLGVVDQNLPALMGLLDRGDVLAITSDHGNDPTLGTRQHTRERTPLLWYRPGHIARPLGRRTSLADTAASIARLAGLAWEGDGTPFCDFGGEPYA